MSLFFYTDDRGLAAAIADGPVTLGLRNNTAGTPRVGDYTLAGIGQGRLYPGIYFRPARWTAHCSDPGSEPVSGTADNAVQAQILCQAACAGHGGLDRCDIEGGEPVVVPWLENDYVLSDIVRTRFTDLPDIHDVINRLTRGSGEPSPGVHPTPGEDDPSPQPSDVFSIYLRFDVIGRLHPTGLGDLFQPGDFELLVNLDPVSTPMRVVGIDRLRNVVPIDRFVEKAIDADGSGIVGDAPGEGIQLIFSIDPITLIRCRPHHSIRCRSSQPHRGNRARGRLRALQHRTRWYDRAGGTPFPPR